MFTLKAATAKMLSEIPAFDTLLRRSASISNLQTMLAQADLDIRAGNVLLLCAISATVLGVIVTLVSGTAVFGAAGVLLGAILPYSYASWRRARRFQKFEEIFPEAISTMAIL